MGKQVYPVVFTPCDEGYLVDVPDFDITTEGRDLADAIDMARGAINLMGITLEDEGKEIPVASDIRAVSLEQGAVLHAD